MSVALGLVACALHSDLRCTDPSQVFSSYYVQSALVLSTIYWALVCKILHKKRHSKSAGKQLSMLIHFLVEFYKAQIFFGFANAVAAFAVAQYGGFEPENLRQLSNTYIFVKDCSLIANSLISNTWLMLFLWGQRSAFNNILFSVTIYLSVGLLRFENRKMTTRDLDLLQKAYLGGPPECGGYKPWIWCSGDFDRHYYSFSVWILTPCVLIIIVVTSAMLVVTACISLRKHIFDRTPNIISGMKSLEYWFHWCIRLLLSSSNKVRKIAWRVRSKYLKNELRAFFCLAVIWTVLVGFTIQLLENLREQKFYLHDWSFGQVVGLLIWVPPLAELLNVKIRGMKRGLQSRLIKPYKVTIETTPEEVLQEDPDSDTELQAFRYSSSHDSHKSETTIRDSAIE